MGIGIERERDLSVPEPLRDDLGVHILLQQVAGMGMPETVEADVRNASTPQKISIC